MFKQQNDLILVPTQVFFSYVLTCSFLGLEISSLPHISLSPFSHLRWNITSWGDISLISQTRFYPFFFSTLNPNPYHTPIYPWNVSLNVTNSVVVTLVYLSVNTPPSCSHSILYLFSYYFHSLHLNICVNMNYFSLTQ